jgi:hypothetical protein
MKYPIPKYPRGKLCDDDEGQIQIAVAVKDGNTLIIDFGKPVAWLGFGLADAEAFVAGIQRRIDEMKGTAS